MMSLPSTAAGKSHVSSAARRVALAAVTVTLVAGATITIAAASAVAGSYHVYSCVQPDGRPAPTDGWSGSITGPFMNLMNDCSSGGELVAEIDSQVAQPVGATATWTFSAPWFASIRAATLWRAYLNLDGGENPWIVDYIAAPNNVYDATDAFDVCASRECRFRGYPPGTASRFAPGNRVVVPIGNLNEATHIYMDTACAGSPGASCPAMPAPNDGYMTRARLLAADVMLAVSTTPSASAVGGSLLTNDTLNGPQDIQVTASDNGPGVYQTIFQIDGNTVERQVIDPNEGRCQDVGQTNDGDAAFLYLQPCPIQVNAADVSFDPSPISDGPHQLRVLVSDAAGGTTTILNHPVIVDNNGAYTTLLARGACNGMSCDDHARLIATSKQRTSFTRHLSRSELTLTGRLVDHTGAPITGAQVQLLYRASEAGASMRQVGSVSTDQSGAWAFKVPDGPSRLLRVAYFSHMKDATPAAQLDYHERVDAAVSMRVPGRVRVGRALVFYGQLAGGYVPRQGEPVQMEIFYAGRWRTIEVLNTNRHGRWAYRYVFSIGGGSYLFRAVALANVGYPFLAAGSRPVRVKVQG
jgi:hypothetical protein